jgi:ubiquitin-protein ligase E3 C
VGVIVIQLHHIQVVIGTHVTDQACATLALLVRTMKGRFCVFKLRVRVGFSNSSPTGLTVFSLFFAQAVGSFTPEQQSAFLKFVTACSRGPLLGFKYLEPPMCIQMAGSMLDPGATERLPTTATCVNLLKLPPYRSIGAIREKLLYAVYEVSGFDLS